VCNCVWWYSTRCSPPDVTVVGSLLIPTVHSCRAVVMAQRCAKHTAELGCPMRHTGAGLGDPATGATVALGMSAHGDGVRVMLHLIQRFDAVGTEICRLSRVGVRASWARVATGVCVATGATGRAERVTPQQPVVPRVEAQHVAQVLSQAVQVTASSCQATKQILCSVADARSLRGRARSTGQLSLAATSGGITSTWHALPALCVATVSCYSLVLLCPRFCRLRRQERRQCEAYVP
jgi:hypothetical protein